MVHRGLGHTGNIPSLTQCGSRVPLVSFLIAFHVFSCVDMLCRVQERGVQDTSHRVIGGDPVSIDVPLDLVADRTRSSGRVAAVGQLRASLDRDTYIQGLVRRRASPSAPEFWQ